MHAMGWLVVAMTLLAVKTWGWIVMAAVLVCIAPVAFINTPSRDVHQSAHDVLGTSSLARAPQNVADTSGHLPATTGAH
jgi:hypothetical protein